MTTKEAISLKERAEHASGARKFQVHFNRVNMQRGLKTVWMIHTMGQCIPATEVRIDVPVTTVYKANGPQPRAKFVGQGVVLRTGQSTYEIVTPYTASCLFRVSKEK